MSHLDPVIDADRHHAALDREQDAYTGALLAVQEDIRQAFTVDIRKLPASRIALPSVRYNDLRRERLHMVQLADAISGCLYDDAAMTALLKVLAQSDCAHVAALREALAAEWISSRAEEIALLRSDS